MATPPMSMFNPQERPILAPSVDKEKYMCCKCRDVLRPPVRQTSCGHRLCLECLYDMRKSSNTRCPGPELENDEPCVDLADEDNFFPDCGMQRELKTLMVLCDYEPYGCRETPTWAKKAAHGACCKFKVEACPNDGCRYYHTKEKVQLHLQTCERASKRCEHCRQEVLVSAFKDHVAVCQTQPQECPIRGCDFQGLPQQIKDHFEDNAATAEHVNLLSDQVQELNTNYDQFNTSLQVLQEEKRTRVSVDNPARSQEQQDRPTGPRDGEESEQAQVAVATDVRHKKPVLAMNNTDAERRERFADLQNVSQMQASRHSQPEQGPADDEQQRLQSVERTVGMHDIRLAEYDLRFQCMESAGYNGKLIWKIKDYQRRKQDAVSGRTLSLYSQPFYTSSFGYKMCARVYLNGDGKGKGSHMSLYFVIMKGEYDDVLCWPFKQRVSLALMDVGGEKNPIADSFRPDPASTSFRKPEADMNIASGCPLFAAQAEVEGGAYVKDDTIYIKVIVDSADL